jgi:hypothetical protein
VKHLAPIVPSFLLLAAVCRIAAGQAVVEYGLGAGRAATTTAPAGNLGKQLGGVFDSLNKAVKAGEDQSAPAGNSSAASKRSATAAPVGKKTASTAVAPAAPVYEDPRHIQAGVGYEEMVRRFGPPSMEITTGPGARTLSYAAREGTVAVEVENDKVVTVATPGAGQSAVVLPK